MTQHDLDLIEAYVRNQVEGTSLTAPDLKICNLILDLVSEARPKNGCFVCRGEVVREVAVCKTCGRIT